MNAPTCPECAKALDKWHRLERRMAARGNFGLVPLPSKCRPHLTTRKIPEDPEAEVMRLRSALNALLAHARRGSPEEKIIAHALNLKPEQLQPQPPATNAP